MYRTLLADLDCSGRGRVPDRNALVIQRNTISLDKRVLPATSGELHAEIQKWFPQGVTLHWAVKATRFSSRGLLTGGV